jgi:transcriptional regulator with XRE-family HTH domain
MELIYNEKNMRLLFAKNLKRLREQQNISQLSLAGKAGLTHNFINDIENCNKWFSAKTLAKLASALKVQPFQFFLDEKQWNSNERNLYLDNFSEAMQKWVGEQRMPYPEKNK